MFDLSSNSTLLFILSLGSNESETEEDEVEKPSRKKGRPKTKEAPKENKVELYFITFYSNN